jgi:hypothetical protein
MSVITSAFTALATALGAVATVRTGRPALETTSATLPAITLVSLNDARATEQNYDAWTYTRSAVIEYKLAAAATYPAAMDTALKNIRAVLVQSAGTGQWLGGHALAVRETAVTFLHPEPHGTDAALQVSIEIDYSE